MKKLSTLLLAALLGTTTVFGQKDVAKECVLFEVFTGVNCPYCPAAANGISQMLEEGKSIAPVAYHTSAFSTSEFYTTETNARANYYSVTSYPTLKADGIKSMSGGGGASESMYSYYMSLYNQRINIQSPFTIDLSCSEPTGTQYTVSCTVNAVGTYTSTNLKVFIVLTQNNIQRNWQGMSSLNFVTRDMIPNQNGTTYSGGSQTITETFDLGSLPKEDCNLTAWIQDYSTKEVFQAVTLSLNYPDFEHDLSVIDASDFASYNCSGKTSASVVVKNNGSDPISSFEIVATADGQELLRQPWSGTAFSFGEKTTVSLPTFDCGAASSVVISVENPNNVADENEENNSKSFSFSNPLNGDEHIIFVIRTDSHPEENRVEWIDMTTDEVLQTLTFDKANRQYIQQFDFTELHCYRLAIYDSGNDGITSYFTIYDKNEHSIFNGQPSVNPFNSLMALEFDATVLGMDKLSDNEVMIYPNPSNGNVTITTGLDTYQLQIFDLSGRKVYDNPQCSDGTLRLNTISNGVYMMKVIDGNNVEIKKLIIE